MPYASCLHCRKPKGQPVKVNDAEEYDVLHRIRGKVAWVKGVCSECGKTVTGPKRRAGDGAPTLAAEPMQEVAVPADANVPSE